MVHKTVIFILVSFVTVVAAEKMSWGDNLNMVKEDMINYLVVMVGEDADLLCQVEQAGRKTNGNLKWSTNGNMVEIKKKATVTKVNGNWLRKSTFQVSNVTLDMNGVTVECVYEEAVLIDGHSSSSYWSAEAVLAVFSFSGENMEHYAEPVVQRMEEKIGEIKNIVAANQDLKMNTKSKDVVTEATEVKMQPESPCSNNAWKIGGCSWLLLAFIFAVKMIIF